jgi:hypothetical protein
MPPLPAGHGGRPKYEVADIVRNHGAELAARVVLRDEQHRALKAIVRCRTAALGGHLDACDACGYTHPSYNSCRDRHCPKCQALAQERWICAREQRVLPVEHFHVVFTIPSTLHRLAAYRRRLVFDAMFGAACNALLDLGQSRLSATLGVTAVLHTWTRELRFHPHVHCIVTAGGLALDQSQWVHTSPNYLFPVKVLGALFRGKLMDRIRRLHRDGAFAGFEDFDDPEGFDRLMRRLAGVDWVVYAKKPFRSSHHVFRYLGRYTHRVGIANSRLVHIDDDNVTFRTKNGRTVAVEPVEFLRRFVQHVLPPRFVKIRHYGLYASSSVKRSLPVARHRLPEPPKHSSPPPELPPSWCDLLAALTGRDPRCCRRCGAEVRIEHVAASPRPAARSPPPIP